MSRQSRRGLAWVTAAIIAVTAFLYLSEGAMDWLRVTLHGR